MDGIACPALWMRHPELAKDLARSGYAFALSWQRAQDASGLKSFSMTPGMVDLSMLIRYQKTLTQARFGCFVQVASFTHLSLCAR
jgi:hypothetical protein